MSTRLTRTHRNAVRLAAAAAAAALAGAALTGTSGPASAETTEKAPHHAQMHDGTQAPAQSPPGMARMHELMVAGNPGMARHHELTARQNPGMARMHELMTRGTR